MNTLRILIVEDHFVSRFGLKALLQETPGLEVVGEARTGRDAVTAYANLRPDLVLMDLRLPELDGVKATYAIQAQDPAARVLVLSSYDTDGDLARVRSSGARGFIKKEAEPEELLAAIRVVGSGGTYFGQEAGRGSIEPPLIARDLKILELVASGLRTKEIAAEMSLTEGTVRVYISHILAKLEAASRAEAVTIAIDRGWLPGRRPPR